MPAYSFRIRFENEKWTNLEELIAAAHAGCFAIALALRLRGAGDTSTELNSEAVAIARLTRDAGQSCPVCKSANITASDLVLEVRISQSIGLIPGHLLPADSLVQRFERWARERLAAGFSLDQAAEALGTSKRTLARRMQSEVGKSPLTFFQDLRIERAVHLLRTTDASVDQIAAEVGYAGGVTLRALLRRRLGRGVREIRRNP